MLSKYSVRKPYTVIVGIIMVIVLGVIAFRHMTTDLLPSMDLPYVVVYTTYVGATPEQVEQSVTRPMESSFATLTDIKNISSNSMDNVSVVIMEFNEGANMDTALIEISSKVDQLAGSWDDAIGAPVTMKLNPDMLPVAIMAVNKEDMDIYALSDYVEDELVPQFESINGVASASASGLIDRRIDVTIEQSRIDVLNSAILREVDEELADAERQLNDAQAQISDGRQQLARTKKSALKQIDDGLDAIEEGADQIKPAIEKLTKERDELQAQRDSLAATVEQLEQLVNMSDEEKQQIQTMASNLAELKKQKAEFEKRLDEFESADPEALVQQRDEAKTQRDSLAAERAALQDYVSDLTLLDEEALKSAIAQLETEISETEAAIESAASDLSALNTQKEATEKEIEDLKAQIDAMGSDPTDTPNPTKTPEKTKAPADTDAPEATDAPADTDAPESTDAPADTDAPESTDVPADTDAPESTDVPAYTDAPEATDAPADTDAPEVTDVPADTDAPEVTDVPADTDAPKSTDVPADTDAPEVTDVPADTDTPEVTDAPADTDTPEVTDAPADTDAPETAIVSEDPEDPTDTPDVTDAPAATDAPADDETAASEDTPKPTEAPDPTKAPETPAPEATAKPTEAPRPEEKPESTEKTESTGSEESGEVQSVLNFLGGRAFADEASISDLKAQLADAEQRLAQIEADIAKAEDTLSGLNSDLSEKQSDLASKKSALETLGDENANVQGRIEEATQQILSLTERIAALDAEILMLDAQIAASGDDSALQLLKQGLAAVDKAISDIENSDAYKALGLISDPEALNSSYKQAKEGLAQIDAGLAQMNSMLDKLNKGIIPGGLIEGIDEDTKLSDAEDQLKDARKQAIGAFADAEDQLDAAAAEIANARKEFNEKRDEALESAGLDGVITVEMISGILGAQNFSMPAGYVYDVDKEQILVRIGDKFGSLDELRQTKLFELGLESIDEVRLLDVASVEITDNHDEVFTKLDGSDGILLSFEKQSTYSTAEVAEAILKKADALMAADSGLHITTLMDQGEYITIIVDSVLDNLVSGGVLAIFILLLFLLDWRPTLTVAFSIPISVVVAFVCMYFSGITLNVLSLSGLSLGIGMLVDNSIVSIENIYRLHEEENMPILKSCVVGVQKVAGALFSSTLTTICVFLPVVFVEGIARDLFADMGLTIAYSLLASLVVAMTVVPAMSSFLMKRSKPRKHRIFSKIQGGYLWLLKGTLRLKPLVLLAAVALLAFTVMQISSMGISFMPEVNSGQMSATLYTDPESTRQDQQTLALNIMNDMMEVDGVLSIGLMGSGSGSLLGGSEDSMSYYIIVDAESGRKNRDIAAEMMTIGEKYAADLSVQASTMDISMMMGSGISINIMGDDLNTLQSIALDVADIVAKVDGAVDIDNGLQESVPEMHIAVDKEKAIDNGLTVAQVYQFVAQKLYGAIEVTQVTIDGNELSVYVVDSANADLTPEDIENLEIEVAAADETRMVRIGDIAVVEDSTSLTTINRNAQRRQVTVSFGIADGYSSNLVSRDLEALLDDYQVPDGYDIALGGENETVMAIMEDLILMIVVAVLMIFLIMVAQFQSFKSPIIVMFTIPLAFTGGMLALMLTGMDLSIVSMLGFLVLSGVVVNNGIVFIDCINQLRIDGYEKREAILEAGRQRLRPILMTTMTTILGMSTMALAQGTGAEMMQPMAVVSIGGLTYSTLMTLFVVPALYDIFNGKKLKAREVMMMKEAAGLTGDEVLEGDSVTDAMNSAPAAGNAVADEAPAAPAVSPEPAAPIAPAAPTIPTVPVVPAAPVIPAEKPLIPRPAPGSKPVKVKFKKK